MISRVRHALEVLPSGYPRPIAVVVIPRVGAWHFLCGHEGFRLITVQYIHISIAFHKYQSIDLSNPNSIQIQSKSIPNPIQIQFIYIYNYVGPYFPNNPPNRNWLVIATYRWEKPLHGDLNRATVPWPGQALDPRTLSISTKHELLGAVGPSWSLPWGNWLWPMDTGSTLLT